MLQSSYAVQVDDLVKDFGQIRAVNNLTFKVKDGEIFGLIGPNGAGKTTSLRIVSTLINPTSGSVKVFGYDVVNDASQVRRIISYLPEEAGVYRNLSGREYLNFMAKFYTDSIKEADIMVDTASEISGLKDRLKDRAKTYSRGMIRRLLLARALMTKPKLAILDEPTSGLDVVHAHIIRRLIREYVDKGEVTILLSSHNMLEVEFLCDRVAIIDQGSILVEGIPSELKDHFGVSNLEEVFMEAVKYAK